MINDFIVKDVLSLSIVLHLYRTNVMVFLIIKVLSKALKIILYFHMQVFFVLNKKWFSLKTFKDLQVVGRWCKKKIKNEGISFHSLYTILAFETDISK